MKLRRRAKRPKPPKLTSSWKLFNASLSQYRLEWRSYALILAVVTIPLNLLNLIAGVASESGFNVASQVAVVIMNVALIWAIVQYEQTNATPSVSQAYYSGSEALVRFLITSILVVLLCIPAALGAAFYVVGFSVLSEAGTAAEQAILIFICLLIASFSMWWLVRFGLAPTITIASGHRPLAALRYSRRLTLGRFWRTFGHYAALILFIGVTAIPIALVTYVLSLLHLSVLATLFFGIVTTFTALPLVNIYLLKLFRDLESHRAVVPRPAPEAEAEAATEPEHAAA